MDHVERRPPAAVPGGSDGIGFDLARQLAANGYRVTITGPAGGPLAESTLCAAPSGTITARSGASAYGDGMDALITAIDRAGRHVDVLCVHGGIGPRAAFAETDANAIAPKVRGAVRLSTPVLKEVARGAGKLLFTSSVAATAPDPFEAVYGGTEAFMRWFGEALRDELRHTGVTVTVLTPGVTDTEFFVRAALMDNGAGASATEDDPADTAEPLPRTGAAKTHRALADSGPSDLGPAKA